MASSATNSKGGALANCKAYPIAQTYAIDSAGKRSAADGGTGTVRLFGTGANAMKVTVPPPDFDPHSATDAQLRMYGFPPRPKAGPARERWNRLYPNHHIDYVVPEMCSNTGVTHVPGRPTRRTPSADGPTPLTSDNWSGGIATKESGGFTAAVVRWDEPTFAAACPTQSGYTIWSGLGGYFSERSKWGLLQTGVDNLNGTGPNDDYAWWEALNQNPAQTLPEQIITNLKVSAGDEVQAVTYYSPVDHTITFQIYNLTTNKLVTLGPWSGIVDQNGTAQGTADEYYDGSSGEIIAERPTYNKHYVNLRQPQQNYSKFLDAELADDDEGDFFPGYQYPDWAPIRMIGSTGNILSEPATFPVSGTPAWNNTWDACS